MVIFKDNDTIDIILYKLLLVITKNIGIRFFENTKNRFVNESNFSMKMDYEYRKLIEKLKKEEYIQKDDTIEFNIISSRLLSKKNDPKYLSELNFTIKGEVNLTDKGKEFIAKYKTKEADQ